MTDLSPDDLSADEPSATPSSGLPRWARTILVIVAVATAGRLGWTGWSAYRTRVLWNEADIAAKDSNWDFVEDRLGRHAWYEPANVEAVKLRAEAAVQRGDRALAAESLARIPDSAPEAADARASQGKFLRESFRVTEAEAALRESLRLNPRQFDARRELIIILGVQRRGPEQEAELWEWLKRGGPKVEALRLLAQAGPAIPPGAISSDADEGRILELALAEDPTNPHIRPALSYFLRGRGRVDDALRMLVSWLGEHPTDAPAIVELLACYRDLGDWQTGRPRYEKAIGDVDELAAFHVLRGERFESMGAVDEAIRAYERAMRIDPRGVEVRYRLGQALLAAGRGEAGKPHLKYPKLAGELKTLVARIADETPDPILVVKAAELCKLMGRDREAAAWTEVAQGPGGRSRL